MTHIGQKFALGPISLVRLTRGGAQGLLIMVLPRYIVGNPHIADELAGVGIHRGDDHGNLDPTPILANVGPLARLHQHGRRGEHRESFDRTPELCAQLLAAHAHLLGIVHEDGRRQADHFVATVTEQPFSTRVEHPDGERGIGGNDGNLRRGIEHGAQQRRRLEDGAGEIHTVAGELYRGALETSPDVPRTQRVRETRKRDQCRQIDGGGVPARGVVHRATVAADSGRSGTDGTATGCHVGSLQACDAFACDAIERSAAAFIVTMCPPLCAEVSRDAARVVPRPRKLRRLRGITETS